MTLPALSTGAACCLFVAGLLHAAVTDLMSRRIVNATVLALLAGYLPLALGAGLGWTVIITSAIAAVLVFGIGFACFCAGWMGGGDVKLAAVAVLWIGAGQVVPYLLLAAVFGALITLLFLGLDRWQNGAGANDPPSADGIPYGPGLVLAGLALFSTSPWFA